MSSYVIPLFPAAAASPLPTRDAVAAELSRLRDRVDAGLPGKADKAPPAAAGNLASLDASGNLLDSGATPASIKAAAVAEVVANAPGTMDTLEKIADILGSSQQVGTVLERILGLESGKADSSSLAPVATSGSYDDLSGKPAIPAEVTVDAALATPGAAADAEAVGDALRSGFTEWEFSGYSDGVVIENLFYDSEQSLWILTVSYEGQIYSPDTEGNGNETNLSFIGFYKEPYDVVTATRHLVTPTKTSQLVNDGSNGVPFAVVSQIPGPVDISGKLDGAAAYPAWSSDEYEDGVIVSHNGRLWRCLQFTIEEPSASATDWELVTLEILKQDNLTPTQIDYINAVPGKVSTNALAGQTYDFSKNRDIIKATADIVQLLGGTVTNNPTEQGGN